jgi:hypothetical protein
MTTREEVSSIMASPSTASSSMTPPPLPACLPSAIMTTTREKKKKKTTTTTTSSSLTPPAEMVETVLSEEDPAGNDEEKKELLLQERSTCMQQQQQQQLEETFDLLAKFASLDASVYHKTMSKRLQGSEDSGMCRKRRTEQWSPQEAEKEQEGEGSRDSNSDDDCDDDDDLRLLFARLESLQKTRQTEESSQQTTLPSIPNLIASLHRWQAQLYVLQQHQTLHAQEIQELQAQLAASARREVAWKSSCIKLQKRHVNVSNRLREKRSLLRRARDVCRTLLEEKKVLQEQNAVYQLQAHEQIMACWQKQQQVVAAATTTTTANALTPATTKDDDGATDYDDDYDLRLRLGSTDTGGTCTSSSNFSSNAADDVAVGLEFTPDTTASQEEEEDIDSSMHSSSQSTGIGGFSWGGSVRKNSSMSSTSLFVTTDGVAVVRFGPPETTATTATTKPRHTHDDEPSESSMTSTTTATTTSSSATMEITESSSSSSLPHVASRTPSQPYQIRFSSHTEQLGIRIRSIPLDELPKPPPKALIARELLYDETNKEQQRRRLPPNDAARGGSSSSSNNNTSASTGASAFFNHFRMGGGHHAVEQQQQQQQQKEQPAATAAATISASPTPTTGLAFVVSGFSSAWDATRNPIKPTLGARILNINGQDVDPSWTLSRMITVLVECQKTKTQGEQEQPPRKQSLDQGDESMPSPLSTTTPTTAATLDEHDDDFFTMTFRNDPLSKQQKESMVLSNNNPVKSLSKLVARDKNHLTNNNVRDATCPAAAAADSNGTQTKPESTATTSTTTTTDTTTSSSFSLNFLKLGSSSNHTSSHNHHKQQQQTAVLARTASQEEKTTESSSILVAAETETATVTSSSKNESQDPTTTAYTNSKNDDAPSPQTAVKENPKSSKGFLASWMNEVEINEPSAERTIKHEIVDPKEDAGAAAGTSPTATLHYVAAESNSMAQHQASGVEPSDSSSSSSSSSTFPLPVVAEKSTSSSGTLGFHAARIHLSFWNTGSSNNNNSGANIKPAVDMKSNESHATAASKPNDKDQTTDQANRQVDDSDGQEANETTAASGRTNSEQSSIATAASTSTTDVTVTASKSVGLSESKGRSTVPVAVTDSSTSSGTSSFHAPRLHLPFWNLGSNNSRADNQPTMATAELRSISSQDTTVIAEASEVSDNDRPATEHGYQNQQQVADTSTSSSSHTEMNSITNYASTMTAAETVARPLQHQQQQEIKVDDATKTCDILKEDALHQKTTTGYKNNASSPMSKLLGGFSNPFL